MLRMVDAFDVLRRHLDGPPKVLQGDFASQVGASQGLVSLWKNRRARPSMGYLAAINAVLGTTADQWLRAKLASELKRPVRRKKAA